MFNTISHYIDKTITYTLKSLVSYVTNIDVQNPPLLMKGLAYIFNYDKTSQLIAHKAKEFFSPIVTKQDAAKEIEFGELNTTCSNVNELDFDDIELIGDFE